MVLIANVVTYNMSKSNHKTEFKNMFLKESKDKYEYKNVFKYTYNVYLYILLYV